MLSWETTSLPSKSGTNLISTLSKDLHAGAIPHLADTQSFSHGHRPQGYDQTSYFNEFGVVINALKNDAKVTRHGNLVAPSLQGTWTLQSVWDTGFLTSYADALNILAVEQ